MHKVFDFFFLFFIPEENFYFHSEAQFFYNFSVFIVNLFDFVFYKCSLWYFFQQWRKINCAISKKMMKIVQWKN